MARWAALVVAATTFLAVPSVAGATPAAPAFTRLMYDVTLQEFVAARGARSPAGFDWSSDGCSTPFPVGLGDTGRSFNFRNACYRHDFGYRNAGRVGRWNAVERKRIDDRLLADMRADCAPRPWTQRTTCVTWAEIYYAAVRRFGGP